MTFQKPAMVTIHEMEEATNSRHPGLPQGPCQCDICKIWRALPGLIGKLEYYENALIEAGKKVHGAEVANRILIGAPRLEMDLCPGDVIAAYVDGTVVLDDGISIWNPLRALAFLHKGGTLQKA
jgi:hypothetical protein